MRTGHTTPPLPPRTTFLTDCSRLATVPGDDNKFQHHIAFPRCGEEGYDPLAVRYTFVFRWVRGVRAYDPLTHRNTSGDSVTNPEEFTI